MTRLLRRSRVVPSAALLAAILALVAVAPVMGTPQPTERPDRTPAPAETPGPGATPGTTPAPTTAPTPGPGGIIPPAPGARKLTIGYTTPRLRGILPLVVAQGRGYFAAAGFEVVELLEVEQALPGLLGGQLDVGVMDTVAAAEAVTQGLPLQVVAGYHNYRRGGAGYGADVLAASADSIAADPGTIVAFLSAYTRALQDIADPDGRDSILALLEAAGVPISAGMDEEYALRSAEFAPFDGGFGDATQGGGLGELSTFLAAELDEPPDLSTLLAWPALLVAQTSQALPPNPVSELLIAPLLIDPIVAVPGGDPDAQLVLGAALDAGRFDDAGLAGLTLSEVDDPLTALLQGDADLAVVPTVDAATAILQGLPVAIVAGHRNLAPGGETYGGDVLMAGTDQLMADPGLATAFLRATLAQAQQLAGEAAGDDPAARAFAPFDGGFGTVEEDGGLGQLDAYLEAELGTDVDSASLIAWPHLVVAQTALGIPANPTAAGIGPVPLAAEAADAVAGPASPAPSPVAP